MLAAPVAFAQEALNPERSKAKEPTQTVEQRLDKTKERIAAGEKDGTLTAQQADNLKKREAKIEQNVAAAKAKNGGHLTRGQQNRLRRAEINLNNSIRKDEKSKEAAKEQKAK
jgi:hypothetical protein